MLQRRGEKKRRRARGGGGDSGGGGAFVFMTAAKRGSSSFVGWLRMRQRLPKRVHDNSCHACVVEEGRRVRWRWN